MVEFEKKILVRQKSAKIDKISKTVKIDQKMDTSVLKILN